MKVFIGCSGWNYKTWKGKFYPEGLARNKWLEHYAGLFNTVEVNNTFYRLPKQDTLKNWKKKTPKDFNFSLKGSRYVTQMKKLHKVHDSVQKFEKTAEVMESKLSCILWQLPPNLHRNDERLESFCKTLKKENKNVIEFRHQSWFDKEIYAILKKNHVSFCSISSPDFPEDLILTTRVGYVRFHGTGKEWYNHNYTKKELKRWHNRIKDSGAEEMYLYFNNDIEAHAAENAQQLMELFK